MISRFPLSHKLKTVAPSTKEFCRYSMKIPELQLVCIEGIYEIIIQEK